MRDEISVITPTGDRYTCLNLLAYRMLGQTILKSKNIRWIIVDDGQSDSAERAIADVGWEILEDARVYTYFVRRTKKGPESGPVSLGRNLLAGLSYVSSEHLAIMEDDDCYFPRHLEEISTRLERGADIAGTVWQKYYHLPSKSYRIFRNRGSALCSTGMGTDILGIFGKAIDDCIKSGSKGIDARLWAMTAKDPFIQDCYEPKEDTCIGMKGMPGRHGIGVGHRPRRFLSDPNFRVLTEWCGPFAKDYVEIYNKMQFKSWGDH